MKYGRNLWGKMNQIRIKYNDEKKFYKITACVLYYFVLVHAYTLLVMKLFTRMVNKLADGSLFYFRNYGEDTCGWKVFDKLVNVIGDMTLSLALHSNTEDQSEHLFKYSKNMVFALKVNKQIFDEMLRKVLMEQDMVNVCDRKISLGLSQRDVMSFMKTPNSCSFGIKYSVLRE